MLQASPVATAVWRSAERGLRQVVVLASSVLCVALLAASVPSAATQAAEPANAKRGECPGGQRWFSDHGVCAARADADCFAGELPGPERELLRDRPRATAAGAVQFRLSNITARVMYLAINPASKSVDFELRASDKGAALVAAEAQFCPTLCPRAGPVMEIDCGAPIPAVRVLVPGATEVVSWSGELMVGVARACGDGPARACSERRAAPGGVYSARFCAFPEMTSAQHALSETNTVLRARPRGTPSCADVTFVAPTAEPVNIPLRK